MNLPTNIAMQMLHQNKEVITFLHQQQKICRQEKSLADNQGDLEREYYYHSGLKQTNAMLKKLVLQQKALKAVLQGK